MTPDIAAAISALRPKAEFTLSNDDFNTLQWLDAKQQAPTWEEVKAKLYELQQPEPIPERTAQQKLEAAGLTVAELKQLLGLEVTP